VTSPLVVFLWGALAAVSATVALLFLRFHRQRRDRLLALFGAAFAVLAAHWAVLGIAQPAAESRPYVYLLRLLAFLLILAALIDKNRGGRGGPGRRSTATAPTDRRR
jgi:hypothetical protein